MFNTKIGLGKLWPQFYMQKAYVSVCAQIRLEEDACASNPDVTQRPLNRLCVASDSCYASPSVRRERPGLARRQQMLP